MNAWKKAAVMLGLAALGWLGASKAEAVGVGSPSYLNIDVTINANLSVSVNGVQSSSQTFQWDIASGSQPFANATSSVTVTNDSGAQTERWQLSTNGSSLDTTGANENWTLGISSTSPGADKFAVQAVFGSSNTLAGGCPAAGAATWDSTPVAPLLTATPTTYTAAVFAAPALNNDGSQNPDGSTPNQGEMFAGSKRALCWQVVTPNTTSTVHTQNIQIIVTAQTP